MADQTKISWSDATWNIITGCSVISPGCTNCYAMRLAGTRLRHHPSRKGLTQDSKAGPVWTGETRFNEQWLDQPLRWKKPRRVFVCAHGDLFHESAPDEWLDRVFAVMALADQHVFQVLTKRPERMREYLTNPDLATRLPVFSESDSIPDIAAMGRRVSGPLPNVWLGTSCEDQQRADERIPILLDTPAAVRFVSVEPMLGPVSLGNAFWEKAGIIYHDDYGAALPVRNRKLLHWVICGCESGPGMRPFDEDWARSLRDQCKGAGVPFFFKQTIRDGKKIELPELDGRVWAEFPEEEIDAGK